LQAVRIKLNTLKHLPDYLPQSGPFGAYQPVLLCFFVIGANFASFAILWQFDPLDNVLPLHTLLSMVTSAFACFTFQCDQFSSFLGHGFLVSITPDLIRHLFNVSLDPESSSG